MVPAQRLDGKAAAPNPQTRNNGLFKNRPIDWKDDGVVTDGKLVTAAEPKNAVGFADALLAAIRGA